MTVTFNEATEKQVAFAAKLAAERGVEVDLTSITKSAASKLIDSLLAQGKPATAPVRADALESGIYRVDQDVFKVYRGQSGRMLAKKLQEADGDWSFEYAGLASKFVQADQRMTLEQAKEFGTIYGVCCNCGATLTDEASIAAGIGPVCATRF